MTSLRERDVKEYPFALVLLWEVGAVLYLTLNYNHWLRAVVLIVGGLLIAGALRLVLTDLQAGLLRVRRRSFDVCAYWGMAALTVAFALALHQR